MRAIVLEKPCQPAGLRVHELPIPAVKPGWVLVKVKAFGINRSEMYTRQGHSPSVKLPRVLGIECVGEIADASDSSFIAGQRVISIMGGLGRDFDGSYAEYCLIPETQLYPIDSDLDWSLLAALPETYYTAYQSLFYSLQVKARETLLIRGGTSSVGLAAAQLAKTAGMKVYSSTRDKAKTAILTQLGVDVVLLDDGTLKQQLEALEPTGVDKVLELVGAATLRQSITMLKPQIFTLEQVPQIHKIMEDNIACGKMVVVLESLKPDLV